MRQYTKQLFINSKFRTNNSTNSSDFEYRLNRPIEHVHRIGVRRVILPFSYYVFDNKSFNFDEGSGPLTITLNGNFTKSEIETELKTQLDLVGSDTYTVSIDQNTYLITISSTGSFSLDFNVNDSAFDPLGFDETTYSTASSHTSPNAVNLNGPLSLFVKSNKLCSGTRGKFINQNQISNVIFEITVAVSPNEIILSQTATPIMIQYVQDRHYKDAQSVNQNSKFGKTLDSIDIMIIDDRGNNINLNGRNIILELDVVSFDD